MIAGRKVETMDGSRRDFLKASALGGAALSFFGFDLKIWLI